MAPSGVRKVILIDANSLVYRAFFALPTTLTTASGRVTNAVYGFTSMLLKLMREEAPDVIVAAFDRPSPTFRHDKYEEYKAQRPPMPEELASQWPMVKDVLAALRIPVLEMDGYEADDILATIARRASSEGAEVLVVTGDRDALQLVSPNVKVVTTKKGITDTKVYDREAVVERFGLPPEKMADMLALKGDDSDNIPGVPGIGEKTAAKLIDEWGSAEGVLEHVDEVMPARFREVLKERADQVRLAKELATLHFEVPLPQTLEDLVPEPRDDGEVRRVFADLEFNTLAERLLGPSPASDAAPGSEVASKVTPEVASETAPQTTPSIDVVRVEDAAGVEALGRELANTGDAMPALALAGDCDAPVEALAVATGPSRALAVGPEGLALLADTLSAILMPTGTGRCFACHDGKQMLRRLGPLGSALTIGFDTMIAAYCLDPTAGDYSPAKVMSRLGLGAPAEELDPLDRAATTACAILEAAPMLDGRLDEAGLGELFSTIELPLVPILAQMEETGVGIDTKVLKSFSKELGRDLENLAADTYRLAGQEFNLGSPKQVGEILFDKLGLATGKKTKTGYSTDASVLSKLAADHAIVEKILSHRELSKLKSTYVDALPKLVDKKSGRLHTTFNQAVTTTGRLSSSNPNLQNIPVRTELGQRIREAFVPARKTDELLLADYSQIELRLLAHFSEEPRLIQAFEEDRDIHAATAAEVFDVGEDAVTSAMRRAAKAVNFGIVYGISAHGLAGQLGISNGEAQDYIDRYFRHYPKVREYLDSVKAGAHRDGYVVTMFGRRRPLPELRSNNVNIRNFGERAAVNMPLQGTAADIIKLAMIAVDRRLREEALSSRMVLQVHDELIFEVPPIEAEALGRLVREAMEGVVDLMVRLKVDISTGRNWREAK